MRVVGCALLVCALEALAYAQAHDHAQPSSSQNQDTWQWTIDGSVFFGYNYQHRKFTDFSAWESQNWLMAGGTRRIRSGTFTASTMLSLEPWTMKDIGSPQAFQTGETFKRAPLIDYQHPHDLIMGLGAGYRVPWRRVTWSFSGGLVGTPAFGPVVFMHRPSAADNPQAPLGHHYLDSMHITPGVLSAQGTLGAWSLDGSWFHGREPDENRLDIDFGPLDSYALRLGWSRGPWAAQVSGAALTQPEALTPYDAKALSASLMYTQTTGRRLAWMAAFGQKREIHGNLEAYLVEGSMHLSERNIVYLRAESVAKDILDAGFHPRGVFHRHRQSQVGALTIGYVRDLLVTPMGRFGVGADATGYAVPENLQEPYGTPSSYHFFIRIRGAESSIHIH